MERASRVMARVDSLKLLASSGEGSIGRFRRDTTLMKTAMGLSAELDSLRARTRALCAQFPDEYWRRLDAEHEFPWEFYEANRLYSTAKIWCEVL